MIKLETQTQEMKQLFEGMLNRANLAAGYLNRVVYGQILQAQLDRWQSSGDSETGTWAPLNEKYRLWKLRKFQSYPGGGSRILIATGRLLESMTQPRSPDHVKITTDKRIEVGTKVEYAGYVNDARDITELGKETVDKIAKGFAKYIASGRS